ncbi:MAG: YbhB/YbcL family Raf kinase inhibitor-like protein [Betaproteobacteria bacterium]|nr:YbhB/YbcL family Raf kinase inhibitor-like protein [Betaproteobacteria bacterium]
MKLTTSCFADGQKIPVECAFCAPDPETHASLSQNLNPDLSWSDLPPGTKSLVLLCHDPDVPSQPDDVNQEGRTVPASLPRIDFFHWVLVDLPANAAPITKGEFASGVTAKGKPGPAAPRGARQGVNDYTNWFAGDADMGGDYHGYDGPCPPWNDSIPHRYVFTLYALDVARCPVEGRFSGPDVRQAIEGHVLASATVTGRYALNPDVKI